MREGGIYYLQGLSPSMVGNQSVLTSKWYCQYMKSEDDSGLSNLGLIRGFDDFAVGSPDYIMSINYDGYIFSTEDLSLTTQQIHAIANDISRTDILTTKDGNLLYSTKQYIGYGLRGTVKAGSSNTQIVDNDGRDFSTLGFAISDKITNLDTGTEYVITGFSNVNATNDGIDFADGGTANTANDTFIIWDDAKFDLDNGSIYPHFKTQELMADFVRQIRWFNDKYYCLNGNYLAELDVDESTFDEVATRLPYMTQAKCFDVNNNRMLIGGGIQGKGRVMLWDGWQANTYLSILELDKPPSCIIAYENGFIVVSGMSIYYTDGYNIQLLNKFLDYSTISNHPLVDYNGALTYEDEVLFNFDGSFANRNRGGVYAYNIEQGFSHVPFSNISGSFKNKTQIDQNVGAMHKGGIDLARIYASQRVATGTATELINNVYNAGNPNTVATFFVKLPRRTKVNAIGLCLAPKYNRLPDSAIEIDVSVSVGGGKMLYSRRTWTGTGNTTTVIKNSEGGSSYRAGKVGQMVEILEGDVAGEFSWITSIDNAGTASEELTVSPAFSSAPDLDNCDICLRDCKRAGQVVTVDAYDVSDEYIFDVEGFESDKLWIEIRTKTDTVSSMALDITQVNVY